MITIRVSKLAYKVINLLSLLYNAFRNRLTRLDWPRPSLSLKRI